MNRILKTFLLWLLVFALPIQGFAAAVRMSCGPAHHAKMAVAYAATAHAHDERDHHGPSDADHQHQHMSMSHDDGHSMMSDISSPSSATATATSASASADTQTEFKSAYCSACAACCVGAVAPPSMLEWKPDYSSSFAPALISASAIVGHIPAGLERPPRQILA